MKKFIGLFMAITLIVLSFNTIIFAGNAPSNNEDYPYVFDLRWEKTTAKWSKYGKVQKYEIMLCGPGLMGAVFETNSTSYNFNNKLAEGTFFFKVRAYNKNTGWSIWEQSPNNSFIRKGNKLEEGTVATTNGAGGAIYNGTTDVQELFSNPSGVWEKVNGLWFFKLINGVYATNMWINSNGIWYYVNRYGVMLTGLHNIDGKTYFFADNGAMYIGKINIEGRNHLFGFDGAMIY